MPRQRMPAATIVICARNAAAHIGGALAAAFAQEYETGKLSVLVVDNGSSDATAEIARAAGARVVHRARPGVAGARQQGWKSARTPIVAFLDSDCVPPRDWLARSVAMLRADRTLGGVGARLIPGEVRTLAERHIVEARILDSDRFWERNALQWPFVATAAFVVRRRAIAAVGGFELRFGRATGEDADLCWKLERAGFRVAYARDIEVVHNHRATLRAMARQVYWYGQGAAAVFAKWRGELGWRRFTDWGVYRRLGWGLAMAIPAALSGRDDYARRKPLLCALDAAAFLAGKWSGSIRRRVLFL